MKICISPAKTFNFNKVDILNKTTPIFNKDAIKIAEDLKNLNLNEIKKIFHCSDKIAQDVKDYYSNFNKEHFIALFFYKGMQYKAINLEDLQTSDILFLLDNIYMADALYGIIRASDEISPYRLDYTCSYDSKSIYKDQIFNYFKEPFINLCSWEYSSLLNPDLAININFTQSKSGKTKAMSTYCKQARGLFIRFLAQSKDFSLENLKSFSLDGYKYIDGDDRNLNFNKNF